MTHGLAVVRPGEKHQAEFNDRTARRALPRHVEQPLLERGCSKINTQVRATNTEVIEFYRLIGYAQDEAVSLGKRLIRDEPAV